MKQKIFFQSSLPRAGSTLLQNFLGQNPDIYPTPTSGLIDLVLGARIGYNENKEAEAGDKELWKQGFYNFCRKGLEGYAETITNKPYILDKSRAWGPYYSLLSQIYPNPKILVMVRDLRAVFASMEKKFRENPDYDDKLMNNINMTNITTQQRVETWAGTHPVGYAVIKMHQTLLDKTANNFLFVRYEDLCTRPEEQLSIIYNYLNIPFFSHDPYSIPQITYEDDRVNGIYGDHVIRNKLDKKPDDFKEVLGEYTCDWIYNNFRWFFDSFGYKR